jgi:hypothetical protein
VNNDEIPLLQWLEDDSKAEQFTVVQSRKKKKRNIPIRLEKNIQDGRVEEEPENLAFCLQVRGGGQEKGCSRIGGGGIKKRILASYVREILRVNNFDFVYVQETMVQDLSDAMIRKIDPNKNFYGVGRLLKGNQEVFCLV